jgi:uncharacterized protein YjiS (DUF1127 family)
MIFVHGSKDLLCVASYLRKHKLVSLGRERPLIRTGDTPVHSPIKDLALSSFTEVAPLARIAPPRQGLLARLQTRFAEWRHLVRSRNELARLTATDWEIGDYGITRLEAEKILNGPARAK